MKVELRIKAFDLKNMVGMFGGTSDPYAVVSVVPNDPRERAYVLGKTEVIKNNLSPEWTESIQMDYELGTPVHFIVSIYDKVKSGDDRLMGAAAFEASSILPSPGQTKTKKLPKNGGTLSVRIGKYVASGTLRFKCSGVNLTNVEGMFSKSDPYFEICSKDLGKSGKQWNVIYRSEHIMNNLDPNWNEGKVEVSALCGGDLKAPLLVKVFDYEKDGKHDPMGSFETTVYGFGARQGREPFTLIQDGKNVGQFVVHYANITDVDNITRKMSEMSATPAATVNPSVVQQQPPPSPPPFQRVRREKSYLPNIFYDYIAGGCEMSLCVAIDFTGSNGDPRDPGSLHHISHDGTKNGYEMAITAIGNILASYDSDKKFPVWGFGAEYGGELRHCFQVGPKEEVDGVEGIIHAYHQALESCMIMSEPTDITEVIQTAADYATRGQGAAMKVGKQKYTILLILTDGGVSDITHTVNVLDQVCDCPLSIVMVGIGNGDFSSMKFLDDRKTTDAKPDICDFVHLNSYLDNPAQLTEATLSEVPGQLVGYFTRNGIMPNPPVAFVGKDIVIEAEEPEIDLSHEFNEEGEIAVTACSYVPPTAY